VGYRAAALIVAGLTAVAALGATLAATQGPGVSPAKPAAHFKVTILHPLLLLPTDLSTDRVALDITNTGGAAGWPKCKVVATATGPHRGAISYWSTTKVGPGKAVHTDVRLTIVNGGARFPAYRGIAARCHAALGPAPPPPPKPEAVVPAVMPTTLPAAQVGSLQMFTGALGVGIGGIKEPDDLAGPVYFLSTSDGGTTWSVTGALPVRLTRYQLTSPDLAFENPATGYLDVYDRAKHHDVVLFTSDGGAEWHAVTVTGIPTSVSLDGQSLWVVAYLCSKPTQSPGDCPSQLLTYDVGTFVPSSSNPVPVEAPAVFPEATLLRRLGPTEGVFSVGGSTPGPRALLVTSNAGSSWQQVVNACTVLSAPLTLSPSGLVALGPGDWLLLCVQPAGMENYNSALYRTGDGGASWQLVAEHSVTPKLSDVGNIGASGIAVSGDGDTLWMTGLNGLSWSKDGGLDWSSAKGVTTGGVFASFASAASSDAWLAAPFKGLYFTANGTTWHLLHWRSRVPYSRVERTDWVGPIAGTGTVPRGGSSGTEARRGTGTTLPSDRGGPSIVVRITLTHELDNPAGHDGRHLPSAFPTVAHAWLSCAAPFACEGESRSRAQFSCTAYAADARHSPSCHPSARAMKQGSALSVPSISACRA